MPSLLHCCSPASDFSVLVPFILTSISPLISLGLWVIWKLKLQFTGLSVICCQNGWSYLRCLFISLFPFASNQMLYCLLHSTMSGTSGNLFCLETSSFNYLFLLAQDWKGAVPGFGTLLPGQHKGTGAPLGSAAPSPATSPPPLWMISRSTESLAFQAEDITFCWQKGLWGPRSGYWYSF